MSLTSGIRLSKYQEIEGWLLKELSSGRFQTGDRFYSEQELADRFHVTKLTIRHAYRNLEDSAYIERQRGKGTFVRMLPDEPCHIKIFRHGIIGVLTSGLNLEQDFKLGRILVESHQAAAREGYLLMLSHNNPDQLLDAHVDGIIVIGEQSPETLKKLTVSQIPAVNYPSAVNPFPTPHIPYRETAQQLCRLFAGGGHRHLMFAGTGNDALMVQQKFGDDLEQNARDCGLKYSTVICDVRTFRQQLHRRLIQSGKPDALLLANSWCLNEVNAVMKDSRLQCPKDVSILVHGSNAAIIPGIPPYSYFDVDIKRCIGTLFRMLLPQIRAMDSDAAWGSCHYHVALRGTIIARNGIPRLPQSPLIIQDESNQIQETVICK